MEKGVFEKVYEAVRLIPRGKVATYGQIAGMINEPKGARVVGWALHKNPYKGLVPCHRVLNTKGELSKGFVFGGITEQMNMLESEGVCVSEFGIVDLKLYQWNPSL
jgi:methylated-DNA-protein-cysteine methyltransferase related protein